MNFFGVHICQDELNALLLCIPFVGFIASWFKNRVTIWRGRRADHYTHGRGV